MFGEEVGDSDGPDLVVLVEPLHLLPGLDVQALRGDRPVDEVKVHEVQAQRLAAVLEGLLRPALLAVPELGGDKDVLTRDARSSDGRPHACFIPVAGGGINVPVACFEGVFHDPLGVLGRDLENAEAKLGDGDAVVECQL